MGSGTNLNRRRAVAVSCAALALLCLGAVAPGAGAAAAPSATWLCKPGAEPNPCYPDLTTTVVSSDGTSRVEAGKVSRKPKFDCFYVYPTVSEDDGVNSDLSIDAEETASRSTRRPASRSTAGSSPRCTGS